MLREKKEDLGYGENKNKTFIIKGEGGAESLEGDWERHRGFSGTIKPS